VDASEASNSDRKLMRFHFHLSRVVCSFTEKDLPVQPSRHETTFQRLQSKSLLGGASLNTCSETPAERGCQIILQKLLMSSYSNLINQSKVKSHWPATNGSEYIALRDLSKKSPQMCLLRFVEQVMMQSCSRSTVPRPHADLIRD
jgi:hypothetical protein